jgi:uracil phosphoribosyltransferase
MQTITPTAQSQLHLISHPLVQHKLTLMRKKEASTTTFRTLLNELSSLMAYEVTRDMPLQDVAIETPLEPMTGQVIDGKKLVFASILRAGNGILDGMLTVVPGARVGHIGLYRDPKTLQAVEYYFKMPQDMHERDVIVVDPMLATGNSAAAAITRLKACKPKSIKFVCLVSCPQGINTLHQASSYYFCSNSAIARGRSRCSWSAHALPARPPCRRAAPAPRPAPGWGRGPVRRSPDARVTRQTCSPRRWPAGACATRKRRQQGGMDVDQPPGNG